MSFDIDSALRHLPGLPVPEQNHILNLIEERERLARIAACHEHFIDFVKAVWPDFIPGAHHLIVAEAFDRIASGKLKRLIINMAPRHTKSEFASVLLPAWYLGKYPRRKVIQASNTEGLASGFGRRVRNMIDGSGDERNAKGETAYQEIFPGLALAADSQAAAGWHTNKGGEYFAIGVSGKVAGKGANLAIVDDPHSEQEAIQAETNPDVFDSVYRWYTSGIRQRLQPGAAIVIVMTRWSKRDLTGQLQRKMLERGTDESGDTWEIIELPAILDMDTPEERSLWPEFWPLQELLNTREEIGLVKFNAQYQQKPTSETSAILKREYWREWGEEDKEPPGPWLREVWRKGEPPKCDYIIQSWDCAATATTRSNYNACTTWGIFKAEDYKTGKEVLNVILLSAFRRRMEFPELKKTVKKFYYEDLPDEVLIENKSAGTQLIQEIRTMDRDIPVQSFGGSSRGAGKRNSGESNDKIARANKVSDIFASGYVWRPKRRWSDEVVEECAEFPYGEFDDYVDTVVQALIRFRLGGFLRTQNDDDDKDDKPKRSRGRIY